MSSISFSGSVSRPDFSTLRKQFDTAIDADVTSGKISSDDAKAIKSAEDDLSKLFDGSPSAAPSGSSSGPSQLKAKVDTLIDGEVKSGKLTSAQADELKSVLQKGAPHAAGGAGAPRGPSGPGGAGGAHKKSSSIDALLQNDDDDDSDTTTDTTNSSPDVTTLLDDLIRKLQSGTDKAQKTQPQFVDYVA